MSTSGDDDTPGGTGDAPPSSPSPSPSPPPADVEPLAPASSPLSTSVDAELASAVGITPPRASRRRPDDEPVDDDGLPDDRRRNRTVMVVGAVALVGGLGVAALVLLGRVNTQRYYLRCTTSQAVAEQGRSFPPWGSARLPGAEWRPVALPPSAQCKEQELSDRAALEAIVLDLLVERTSAILAAPNLLDTAATAPAIKGIAPLDLATQQLEQALLLSRSPDRADQRKQVERLQGDVLYWRASLRLREATGALTEAARQFDQAALARPMHVTNAGAWAELVRRAADELHAGPDGSPAPSVAAPVDGRPPAPVGTALPVEPAAPATGSDAPAALPDAGVPSGGVLL